MAKSFTGVEFIKALSEGSLREPVVKEGIVKPADDLKAIFFSEGTSCLFWTKIPVEMIEQVEYITTVRCQDHQHPLIRLFLKEPPSENEVAAVLSELLRTSSQSNEASLKLNAPSPLAISAYSAVETRSVAGRIYITIEVHCPKCGCFLGSFSEYRESSSSIYVGAIVTISYTGSCYNKNYCGSGAFDWQGTVTSGKVIRIE